ncbi:MAG TPA: hypothetical protein VI029_16265 [Mycobacterium sp.]
MTAAVAPLVRQIEARARQDAGFAAVLDELLLAPTTPQGTLERVAARSINERRRAVLASDFLDGALATSEVQRLLRYATPQAVHRLRSRGRLLGAAVGNQTWFPAWQFDDDRLRPDLPRILDLVTRFTSDSVAADRIMRMTRDELDGSSITEALRDPATADAAWRILTSLGA